VASAAYRSGEKLHNNETGLTHDFTRKGGVVMSEILLPENAPDRYSIRETLWNEVQQVEKRSDAQLAREVEVALPKEIDREEQIECVRGFIKDNFVAKGMIADWSLHDKGDGNPHAHILLTMRGFDENKKWKQKQKTVFANAVDEQGRAIYDPDLPSYDPKRRKETADLRIPLLDENGKQKTRVRKGKGTEYLWCKLSIPSNDWNDKSNAEVWRESWAEHCNKYLDAEHKIDHRSYARQGAKKEPLIHEGVTARKMEAKGKSADRCQQNREIKMRNAIMEQLSELKEEITQMITEKTRSLYERFKRFDRTGRDAERTRGNDEYPGGTAGRNRGTAERKRQIERTAGRIDELKRTVSNAGRAAKISGSKIAADERRNLEIRRIRLAAGDLIRRLRKLRERRERYERTREHENYARRNRGRSR
jgi:ATP-dependent exoDNAse (exonuclease V) alpha subunit